jgi:hypothetical protein
MEFSLIYSGVEGQIFSGIALGQSPDPLHIKIGLSPSSDHIVLPFGSLRMRKDVPHEDVWLDPLKKLWRGSRKERDHFRIPLGPFVASFVDHPTPATRQALAPLLVVILQHCRENKKSWPWYSLLRKSSPATQSQDLMGMLKSLLENRTKYSARYRKKRHRSKGKNRPKVKYTFSWALLDCLVMSNWDRLKKDVWREEFLITMAALADDVSSDLAVELDQVDIKNSKNAFYQFLTHTRIEFAKGAGTSEERLKRGLASRRKKKSSTSKT